jgi:hypothetical protein
LNKSDPNRYKAVVINKNVPGRARALDIEQGRVNAFAKAKEAKTGVYEGPPGNRRPKAKPCP